MRVVAASLGFETRAGAFALHLPGQHRNLLLSRAEAEPHHAGQAAPFERAELFELELERPQAGVSKPVRDAFGDSLLDVAEKANRQVEVGFRSPAKFGRPLRAIRDVAPKGRAVQFGQRQPEERPDLYRTGLAQCVGAQAPGAVGRQPNCELTESMPAARLS